VRERAGPALLAERAVQRTASPSFPVLLANCEQSRERTAIPLTDGEQFANRSSDRSPREQLSGAAGQSAMLGARRAHRIEVRHRVRRDREVKGARSARW
jgi:hypothetical protein